MADQTLFNNVKKLRLQPNKKGKTLTQAELADTINVSRQTIHSVETGKFSPSTILALKIVECFRTHTGNNKLEFENVFNIDEAPEMPEPKIKKEK